MEIEGGNEKKLGVLIYELLGTCILTYTVLVSLNNIYAIVPVYIGLLTICWKISGGHFNPMLTISVYISQKNFGGNAVLLAMMIAGQFVGTFIGFFWAWLTLMDKDLVE